MCKDIYLADWLGRQFLVKIYHYDNATILIILILCLFTKKKTFISKMVFGTDVWPTKYAGIANWVNNIPFESSVLQISLS